MCRPSLDASVITAAQHERMLVKGCVVEVVRERSGIPIDYVSLGPRASDAREWAAVNPERR